MHFLMNFIPDLISFDFDRQVCQNIEEIFFENSYKNFLLANPQYFLKEKIIFLSIFITNYCKAIKCLAL